MPETTRPSPARAEALPACPITGRPALRRIQSLSPGLLDQIWRFGQGTDIRPLLAGVDEIGIYESPTGLVFFDPPIVGDGNFYQTYYRRPDIHASLTEGHATRVDFATAAGHIPAGASVVDVGCGPALFRHHVTHARYTGLDPYAPDAIGGIVVQDTLENHARQKAGTYDVATAFHVIEHVPDPRRHAELMASLVKPGGLLILAAPLHPSPLSEIPNLPLNLPPHHVTWWNPSAFEALAGELGLDVVEARALPVSLHQGPLLWLNRFLFQKTEPPSRYVSSRLTWHASIWLGYQLGRIARRFKPLPDDARPIDAMLVARKPG